MDKNYRIHTNIATDTVLNVNMQQDYDFLEVLTMRLRQKDAYRLHSSNYGVIIGRVLANDAFGIPNARISVFIERDTDDPVDIENIYPYSEVTSKDKDGRRYNLLPDYSDDDCYRIVGTFPNKRLLLDNDIEVEIYEKYWKYTTVTNNAGDYMIFGVPSGNQQIHVDLDLSDIGMFSQKPRDFEYKGYNITMFDNPNQFKESTNLDGLAQLFSQDKSVFVYPFWGDADNGIAAITRCDVQIQYKFEPTCVFMGSIISDNEGNAIGHKCAVDINNGMNDQLIAGEGIIEMIRKTQDGLVEEYQIQGNQLIDSDGVWCYQIPMNLDYVGTDEYGNVVPTDNPNKGIPTRAQVRFRISKHDTGDEGFSHHTAKYLVPMNPIFSEKETITSSEGEGGVLDGVQPVIENKGQEIEDMYIFGSNTPQSCFRDLYWNNVYSVKNYIPKVQVARRPYSKNYGSLKGANLAEDKNPIPFNKLRIDLPFLYVIVCIIFDIISFIVEVINRFFICTINRFLAFLVGALGIDFMGLHWHPLEGIISRFYIPCVTLGEGLSDKEIFAPGCDCSEGEDKIDKPNGETVNPKSDDLKDLVVEKLAEDFKIVKLDLQQDWINGCLYMPLWYWRKRKKKTFLFGLFTLSSAKNQYCDCDKPSYKRLRTYVTCNVKYRTNSFGINDISQVDDTDSEWHKKRADRVTYANGLIKGVENKDGLTAYYYAATQATRDNNTEETLMSKRTEPFYAIRLYATDIILLGNLNEDNLYGIPQFFKVLPPTSANIPQIATIEEDEEMTPEAEAQFEEKKKDINKNESLSDVMNEEELGTVITTGMNWRHNGGNAVPAYAKGLFMELACTEAYTKAKSCFNVERLSELGVNVDMNYNMTYTNGGSKEVKYGMIYPDGFISKLELDDMENRAMFATMNHVGFVPQVYQDSISGYTTQVEDEHTGYLIPKFRYIYPVDFDGRQQLLMTKWDKGFSTQKQHLFDEADESYITFRLGADADPSKGERNRMRHYYKHYPNETDKFSMPVYNNSFYFYFGINKGSTAIDKFNKMFYSECFRNKKEPFSFNIESRGKAVCPSIYKDVKSSYGYIHFKSDDIQTPFAYALYDSTGELVISEVEVTTSEFVIGGKMEGGNVVVNDNGEIRNQEGNKEALCVDAAGHYLTCPSEPPTNPNKYAVLENDTYVLDITDANGRTLSEEIKLTSTVLSFGYESHSLGTKYYNDDVSPISYICNSHNQYYGTIRVGKFYIDGYEFGITTAQTEYFPDDNKYVINATGSATTEASNKIFGENLVAVVFELTLESNEYAVSGCMCNNVASDVADFAWNNNLKYFEFRVYRPNTYVMSITLMCKNKQLDETRVAQNINVGNGEDFDAFLNNMPVRFMIGTVTDDKDATVANTSHFYSSTGVTDPTDTHINGWFNTHREEGYKFSAFTTTSDNDLVWSKYVQYQDINNYEDRKNILKYKFNTMFSLSNTSYISSNGSTEFRYEARGGVAPTLYRVLYPDYSNNSDIGTMWKYCDKRYAPNLNSTPNVVGYNYRWNRAADRSHGETVSSSPGFNGIFKQVSDAKPVTKYVGNYFAAFTNNGRYTSTLTGSCSIMTMPIPTRAAVNLESNIWKPLDTDMEYPYDHPTFHNGVLKNAHTRNMSTAGPCDTNTQPYLRTLYVDRKIDYDLIVWTPTPYNLKLHVDSEDKDLNKPLNNIRISGLTYNGIEMSYDDEYNIISANADGTPDKHLEYSYDVNHIEDNGESNAITIYNEPDPDNVIWREEDVYVFNNVSYNTKTEALQAVQEAHPEIEDEEGLESFLTRPNSNKSYLKRLYTAAVNGFDIRQLFWSTFNKKKLLDYWTEKNGGSATPPQNSYDSWLFKKGEDFYIFNHKDEDTVYNGDFKVLDGVTNYPTKRLVDIGNINGVGSLSLTLTSCSYRMSSSIREGQITAKTNSSDDSVKFNLYFQNNIVVVTPEGADESYANITFTPTGSYDGNYRIFSSSVGSLYFKFTTPSIRSNGTAYNRCPRLIKILDISDFKDGGTYGTDAITYIKTTSQVEKDNLFGSRSLDERIDDATMITFNCMQGRYDVCDNPRGNVFVDNSDEWGDFDVSANTEGSRSYWYYIYDTSKLGRIRNTDKEITRITMFTKSINLSGIKVFGILNSFDYYDGDIYRTNHIRTIEISNIFDARNVELMVDTANTYVCVTTNQASTTINNVNVSVQGGVTVNLPESSGGGEATGTINEGASGTGGEGSGGGTTDIQSFYQVVTFIFKCGNNETNPLSMLNQAFANINNMMGATLIFSDGTRPKITVSPEVIEHADANTIEMKASMNVGDGIFADNNWNGHTHVDLLLNTNGFVYKLSFGLTLENNGQAGGYNASTNQFDNPSNKLETKVKIT